MKHKIKTMMVYMDYKDADLTNGHCYLAPLRLRGGGDNDDPEMTHSGSMSGGMGAGGSNKRGPPSPGGFPSKLPRISKQAGEINELIGWIEHTVIKEKYKKKIECKWQRKCLIKLTCLERQLRPWHLKIADLPAS